MVEGEPIEEDGPISGEPEAEMEPVSTPEAEASTEIEKGVTEINSRLEQIERANIEYFQPVGFSVQGGKGIDPILEKNLIHKENAILYGGLDMEAPQEAIDQVKQKLGIAEKPLRKDTYFDENYGQSEMELYPTAEKSNLVFTITRDPKSKEIKEQRFVRIMQPPR